MQNKNTESFPNIGVHVRVPLSKNMREAMETMLILSCGKIAYGKLQLDIFSKCAKDLINSNDKEHDPAARNLLLEHFKMCQAFEKKELEDYAKGLLLKAAQEEEEEQEEQEQAQESSPETASGN